jgi:hypothetical protein
MWTAQNKSAGRALKTTYLENIYSTGAKAPVKLQCHEVTDRMDFTSSLILLTL